MKETSLYSLRLNVELEKIIKRSRHRLIQMHYKAQAGHIGGNLSCLDLLLVLYHQVMVEEDRFILSKGHAAGAWYITLWTCGLLSEEALDTFSQDGGLPGHPSNIDVPGFMFPTGSLGHGLPLASGLALAAKERGASHKVYCLCSDGEWQEGSNWEALIFAVHHKLNLTIIIDQNGWQGFGRTDEVSSICDLTSRISAFEIPVLKCSGHDSQALFKNLKLATTNNGPTALILETVKGHGIPFLEDCLESHYLPLTETQYRSLNPDDSDLE